MNVRPTRAPAPPLDFDSDGVVIEQRVNHATPALRQQQETVQHEPPRPHVQLPITGFAKLAGAIAAVMAEIEAVGKSGENKFHNYKYAKMQDLLAEVTPLMGKHGVVLIQSEIGRDLFDNGTVLAVRYEFTILHSSGEIWPERPIITGVSSCRTSKGTYDDKSFNKAHTAARKYFLMSLFQIPTEDAEDADRGGQGQQNRMGGAQQAQRRAPAPDGKPQPQLIPIVSGEPPATWAERFKKAIATATSRAEIDAWYDANVAIFNKVQQHDQDTYNNLLDSMDGRELELKRTDPISSGPARTAATVNFDVEEWLTSLENAFGGCEDAMSLAETQDKYMTPHRKDVIPPDWQRAVKIVQTHLARIEANG